MYLRDFKIIRPNFEQSQEHLLEWVVGAHVGTSMRTNGWSKEDANCRSFDAKVREDLFRIGLGNNKIRKRGFQIKDCNHQNWDQMEIYNIDAVPEGYLLQKRMEFYNQACSEVLEQMYGQDETLPPHLVHVTCTGYIAPSPAQKLISSRSSGKNTTVTHAYHMGCYASIPAVRMAMGHFALEHEQTDILHTELCSLHMNPAQHSIEQLVIQSLFADGFIRYSLGEKSDSPAFKILAAAEQIIEDSVSKMTWDCSEWGFQMSLSKDIPVLIRRNLEAYLDQLARKCGLERDELKNAYYAIHPGGPKIIEQVAEKLELEPDQVRHSVGVLQDYGNMSSATLPHIWARILKDESIKPGQRIVSMAFGPGLSICGALFEKR